MTTDLEYALLKNGLVIGPIFHDLNTDTISIKARGVVSCNISIPSGDAQKLLWRGDGRLHDQWMTNGQLDILERFQMTMLDVSGKQVSTRG